MSRRFSYSKSLNLALQLHNLKASSHCKNGKGFATNRLGLRWEFDAQPLTPISRRYSLLIKYPENGRLKVVVTHPNLTEISRHKTAAGESIPHVYSSNHPVEICIHKNDWKPDMIISRTIVPWAVEWLFYFEVWLATGEWKGGGHGEKP